MLSCDDKSLDEIGAAREIRTDGRSYFINDLSMKTSDHTFTTTEKIRTSGYQ